MQPVRRIGILQPVYLPWLGYFEQMQKVDHFVFQDDAQYTRADWRNRNRINSEKGPVWLTIPITKAPVDTAIDQIEICHQYNWPRKHIETIKTNYAKMPSLDGVASLLGSVLSEQHKYLADIVTKVVVSLASELGIHTPVSRSRIIKRGKSTCLQGRLVEIARAHDATHIYLGAKAREYMFPEFFSAHGITLEFQKFNHPIYPQKHGEFLSHLSIIDFLINVPPQDRRLYFPNFESDLEALE